MQPVVLRNDTNMHITGLAEYFSNYIGKAKAKQQISGLECLRFQCDPQSNGLARNN